MGRLENARRRLAGASFPGVVNAAYRRTLFEAYCYVKNREYEPRDKRVWVHIGAHKTGSTTLQRVLKRGRSRLRESSVAYDGAGYELGKRLMWESPLPEAELNELSESWQRRIASRRERIILLSCEGFFGIPYLGYANGTYVARDLRRILGDYPVDVIAVVRRQDRWTESTYQQYVRRGSVATFGEFLRECGPFPPSWDELLHPWVAQFGRDRVHAHLFETTFRDDVNIVDRLFGALGEPLLPVTYEATRANPGLSATGLEVLRRCNDILDRDEGNGLRRWVAANLRSTAAQRYFSDDERAEFVRRCADSNARLFRDWFPDVDRTLYIPEAPTDVAGGQS